MNQGKLLLLLSGDIFMQSNLYVEIETDKGKTFRCDYSKVDKIKKMITRLGLLVTKETFLQNPNEDVDYDKQESLFKKQHRWSRYFMFNGVEDE